MEISEQTFKQTLIYDIDLIITSGLWYDKYLNHFSVPSFSDKVHHGQRL